MKSATKCQVCNVSENLLTCGRCKQVYYCGKQHQVLNWKDHKAFCCKKEDPKHTRMIMNLLHNEGVVSASKLNDRTKKSVDEHEDALIHPHQLPEIHLDESLSSDSTASSWDDDTIEDVSNTLIKHMNDYGLCVLDNFLGDEKGSLVRGEVINMYNSNRFKDGQLVSERVKKNSKNIRGDEITWINGTERECSNIGDLIRKIDRVISQANRTLTNGKMGEVTVSSRTKAMVACYPGHGSQYVKHVDNPNKDGRCITAIYYLNKDWDVHRDGGLLRIFPSDNKEQVADIEPLFDRVLFFWSDRRNPHEVQPSFRTRYAITLWYFDTTEREEARKRFPAHNYVRRSADDRRLLSFK